MTYLQRAERKLVKKVVFDMCRSPSTLDVRAVQFMSTCRFVSDAFRRRLADYFVQFGASRSYRVSLRDGFDLVVCPRDSLQCRMAMYGSSYQYVWEPQTGRLLVKLLSSRAGSCVIAGGHIGYFPLLASTALRGKEGNVHTFEPNDEQRGQLLQNVEINGRSNIEVEPYALFREGCILSLVKDEINLKSRLSLDSSGGTMDVEAVSLDDYLSAKGIRDLVLVLLDIEGAEPEAFDGAKVALSAPRDAAPDLIFELVPGRRVTEEQERLLARLKEAGYELFVVEDSYDYSVHVPINDETVSLHPVSCLRDVIGLQQGLKLPDPNIYATKRPERWARDADGRLQI